MSTTTSFSPYDGRPLTTVTDTDPEGVVDAVEQARRAAPVLAETSPEHRRAWLFAVAENL